MANLENPEPQAARTGTDKLPFWKRAHYNTGAYELPLWKQVFFYAAIVVLVGLLLRLILFG